MAGQREEEAVETMLGFGKSASLTTNKKPEKVLQHDRGRHRRTTPKNHLTNEKWLMDSGAHQCM
jgi:hypothetical protein